VGRGFGTRLACALLGPAVAFAAAARDVHGQSCPLYYTDFGAISGPPDLVEGDLRVLWCDATSSIATSSFCNSGNALKLDSSGDDPVVLVATGNAGCTAIEVRFRYAQFAASGTMVKWGTTAATTASCTASTPNTLGALTVTGGACTEFSAVVPLNGAKGLYLRFDHGTNANAITIDDLEFRRVGCCTTGGHDCCSEGTAGCADSAIAACVCAQDPFCCDVQWDAQCVAEVGQFGCGSCGGGGACLDALDIDFGGVYTGSPICSVFPAVFESCQGTAPFLSSSLGCTGPADMALRGAHRAGARIHLLQAVGHARSAHRLLARRDRVDHRLDRPRRLRRRLRVGRARSRGARRPAWGALPLLIGLKHREPRHHRRHQPDRAHRRPARLLRRGRARLRGSRDQRVCLRA
jgi:hypothetical protein